MLEQFGYRLLIFDKKNLAHLMRSIPDWTTERELFFSVALLPYYDGGITWEGMDAEVGHIIYRLTDLVDPDDRKAFAIYPSSDGSVTTKYEYEYDHEEREVKWDSLEDWRREWERTNPNIPDHSIVNEFIMEHLQKDPPAELKEGQS